MANKKVTDLQLRSSVISTLSIPADDGVQTYRVTPSQMKDYILANGNVVLSMLADNILNGLTAVSPVSNDYIPLIDTSDSNKTKKALVSEFYLPSGIISPFGGTSAPTGFLLCDGTAYSRSTYSGLYTAIGTAYGQGDGSTTFNVPDFRGMFLRGKINIPAVTGTGSASSNNATFTAHGINRTGMIVRMTSGALTGLAVSTDYYAIVIDANTLAFATTYANALASTKIVISGVNTAVVQQWLDPDVTSRTSLQNGGNTGTGVGSFQPQGVGPHNQDLPSRGNQTFGTGSTGAAFAPTGTGLTNSAMTPAPGGTGSNDTRPNNVSVNYIIKT